MEVGEAGPEEAVGSVIVGVAVSVAETETLPHVVVLRVSHRTEKIRNPMEVLAVANYFWRASVHGFNFEDWLGFFGDEAACLDD